MERFKQRFESFEKAFNDLTQAMGRITEISTDKLVRAGFIQTYEYTIELAWKTLKDFLEAEGFPNVASPKKVVRLAYQQGYVENAETWMQALNDRNLSVHTYNESMAVDLSSAIIEKYYPIIKLLYYKLKEEASRE